MSHWVTPAEGAALICECGHTFNQHGPQGLYDDYEADLECRAGGCECDQFKRKET